MSFAYNPEDAYWGQLSGCLEAINAGTTLVLDHAHIAYTPEHGESSDSVAMLCAKLTPLQPLPRYRPP